MRSRWGKEKLAGSASFCFVAPPLDKGSGANCI